MKQDNLYTALADYHSFTFNDEVVAVFDDMATRSIPGYRIQQYVLSEYTCHIITQRAHETCVILDIGCSTGNTLLSIDAMALQKNIDLSHTIYYALDNSEAMCSACKEKCALLSSSWQQVYIELLHLCKSDEYFQNIQHRYGGKVGVIILHFILQFIPLEIRAHIVHTCWKLLGKGGVLMIGDKLKSSNIHMQNVWEQLQYRFKHSNGYSDMQIQSKKRALQDVLIPQNVDDFRLLLNSLPHGVVEPYFIHGEFQCYAVSKEYF